jgi:DNA-binding beta-propeller fold protein YncE
MKALIFRGIVPFTFLAVLGGLACGPSGGTLIGGTPTPVPWDDDDDDATDDDDAVVGPFANLVLNELISSGDDVIEVVNLESTEQDIGGWGLRDSDPDHRPWIIPEGTLVPAGGFIHFIKDESDIGLGDEDGAALIDPSGEVVDEIEYNDGGAALSWCRFPDGSGSWTVCTRPSPGLPNVIEAPQVNIVPLYMAGLDRYLDPEVRIYEPNELAFDSNGRLWAGDQENVRVQIFDTDGSFLATVGGQGTGPGQFAWSNSSNRGPESMKEGSDGNMYVVDRIGDRVNVYDIDTFEALPSVAEGTGMVDPTGFVTTSVGLMYVGDQNRNEIRAFTLDGEDRGTFQTHVGDERILNKIETLAVDEASDRLFATSESEQRVEVFRLSTGDYLDQHVTQLQGGGGIEPGRISVSIEGIITDQVNGWFFVNDEEAGRFMLHDLTSPDLTNPAADFAFLGAFGTVGTDPGQFRSPDGIAVSAELDRVAIADQANDRVQVFALSDIAEALSLPLAP